MIDKQSLARHFDHIAPQRSKWFSDNYIYHKQILDACYPLLNANSRVLELGCNTGDLLHALKPAYGVGVDISPNSIEIASSRFPSIEWLCADAEHLPHTPPLDKPFDLIVMADLAGYLDDIQATLESLHRHLHSQSRLVISLWNWMWQPLLRIGENLQLKAPDADFRQNWLSPLAMSNIMNLAGFETVQVLPGLLFPYNMPPISSVINSFSYAPVLRRFTLLTTIIARPAMRAPVPAANRQPTVSIIIPSRNEVGNIDTILKRTPEIGMHTELLFVDGNSTDGTPEKILEQIAAHPERDIKLIHQVPPHQPGNDQPPDIMLKLGKGDAVRKGFAAASGDILMILDSDLSVPPEDLPRFYEVLAGGQAQFANGTRFIYPQQEGAMRPLNRFGNIFFNFAFSWLLDQPISDTLCGTKALYKSDYEQIALNRSYFGDFDPFGDFDLLFGAAHLGYRIMDVPIRYQARTYGLSKVRVSMHGPLLARMSLFALWKLKLRPLLLSEPTPHPAHKDQQDALDHPRRSPVYGWLIFIGLLLWLLRFRSGNTPNRKR